MENDSIEREKAISYMEENHYEDAIEIFSSLINENDQDWSLYYMIGQCFRFTNQIQDAIKNLKLSSELNKKESQIFLALGIAYQLGHLYSEAIQSLLIATQLNPDYVLAFNSLGLTYKLIRNFEKALENYSISSEKHINQIVDKIMQDPRSHKFKNTEGGKTIIYTNFMFDTLKHKLKSKPTYAIIQNNIGCCYLELGNIELAKKTFIESIEFIPEGYNYPDPYKNLESINI